MVTGVRSAMNGNHSQVALLPPTRLGLPAAPRPDHFRHWTNLAACKLHATAVPDLHPVGLCVGVVDKLALMSPRQLPGLTAGLRGHHAVTIEQSGEEHQGTPRDRGTARARHQPMEVGMMGSQATAC